MTTRRDKASEAFDDMLMLLQSRSFEAQVKALTALRTVMFFPESSNKAGMRREFVEAACGKKTGGK